MDDPKHIEGQYRVKSDGPDAPWKDGEPIFPKGALGNFLSLVFALAVGYFVFHWLMPAT